MSAVQQGVFVLCAISCLLAAPILDPDDDLSVLGLRYESFVPTTPDPSNAGSIEVVEPKKQQKFDPGFLLTRWFHNRAGEKIYY